MSSRIILFCSEPFQPNKVDESFELEATAAVRLGYETAMIDLEELLEGNVDKALRKTPVSNSKRPAVYRGWMLTVDMYAILYECLLERGIQLINDPMQYRYCHWLPQSYAIIANVTAKTVWIRKEEGFDSTRLMQTLEPFGGRAVIVKDYVKSQKHYWKEACYIPDSSDPTGVERVVSRFLALQGEDLVGGLVFREFVPLRKLTDHSKSGMPVSAEYRVFVLDGDPFLVCDYWKEGQFPREAADLTLFRQVLFEVQSRFFTMDIAQKADGGWMIVELGDAQVSGLQTANPIKLYQALLTK